MKWILQALSLLILALFAGIWIWMGVRVLSFSRTPSEPMLVFSDAQVNVAGFLASAVGAGTASVLGIEIQKVSGDRTVAAQVNAAVTGSWLLISGILLYAAVGTFILIVWFSDSGVAPDMVGAFALGVLGWLAGAFAAVFRKQ